MTAETIIRAVSLAFDVPEDAILGESRPKRIAEARKVVYWIARIAGGESFPAIGAMFTRRRDHSGVIHGVNDITRKLQLDAFLSRRVSAALELLGEGGAIHRPCCGMFVGAIVGDRPADFLSAHRTPDDRCANPECGLKRKAHHNEMREVA